MLNFRVKTNYKGAKIYSIKHHKRLKEKPEPSFGKKPYKNTNRNRKGNKKLTEQEQSYLCWLNENRNTFSCLVCGIKPVQFHHVKRDSTDSKNHKRLIPLCVEHHLESLEFSAHGNPKKWREAYPMDVQYRLADKIYNRYEKEIL